MTRLLVVLTLFAVLVSACSTPGSGVIVEVTATPTPPAPTETPAPTEPASPDAEHPAVQAAIKALAAALGISADQIRLVSLEAVEWPDSCLGVTRIDALCAQGVVPGYRIILVAAGQQYEYHTNADGTALTPAGELAAEAPTSLVDEARQALARALGLALESITVVKATPVEWPDSCLGVSLPGQACAEAITPGYLVELEANGRRYEYHTNQTGSVVRPGTVALDWSRNGGIAGFCDILVVFASGEVMGGNCRAEGGFKEGVLTAEERAQLEAWLDAYTSVIVNQSDPPGTADGMEVKLNLYGTGTGALTESAQQDLVLWGQDVYNRLAQ
jgi:hypothetical protein